MTDWSSALQTLGSTGLIVGAGAWVLRSAITHWLARGVAIHKATISLESAREIESLKHALQLEALKQSTTFSQLHTKRSEIVGRLYELLVDAQEAVEVFIDPRFRSSDPGAKDRYERAFRALRALYQHFTRTRIYLTAELCSRLDALFRAIHSPAWGASYYQEFEHPTGNDHDEFEARKAAWVKFRDTVPPIMQAVEAEFRTILGVAHQVQQDEQAVKLPPAHRLLAPDLTAERFRAKSKPADS